MRLEIGIDERGVANLGVAGPIGADDGQLLVFALEAAPPSATIVLDLGKVTTVDRPTLRVLARTLCRLGRASRDVCVVMPADAGRLAPLQAAVTDSVRIVAEGTARRRAAATPTATPVEPAA
jgi:hypothetical protein